MMRKKNKRCVLILPYFGQFNNYFPFFLKSCGANPTYTWMIFTDNEFKYACPENVHVIKTTLDEIRKIANEKFGFKIVLESAYKLCDYKPAYGFLFEKYIKDFDYWGHCDCDLIFGNLEKNVTPLLNEDYDKLFAAGHLTIYKNTYDNNRRFMKSFKGRVLYKEAFTTDKIFVFDEDCNGHDNVHSIFREDGARIYEKDLSMNPSVFSAKFIRAFYDVSKHDFVNETYKKARYYWNNGNVLRIEWNGSKLVQTEFAYIHLQMRKMRVKVSVQDACFEILPDRFVEQELPKNRSELHLLTIGWPYLYWIDKYKKRVTRKWKKIVRKTI